VLLAIWLGCTPPVSFPEETLRWTEVSLAAQGSARIHTEITRETLGASDGVPDGGQQIATRVLRTVGEIQIGSAEPLRFDSSEPRAADPWVLRWQHTVGSVPAGVTLDAAGRPEALQSPDRWQQAVREAVTTVHVPPGTAPPVDADAFLADLARTFPGQPPEGPWARKEPLAGVDAVREEVCGRAGTRDGAPMWRCEGVCRARAEEGPQLFETDCWTEVWLDRRGLMGVETGYSGTRVWMEGGFVNDVPIAGQRLVVRSTP